MAALASDVELLLLDEPAPAGLDPSTRQAAATSSPSSGRTVLLSSHILGRGRGALRPGHHRAAEGRAVESGTLTELRHLTQPASRPTSSGPPPTR